jgi:HJR/Mrr/RecB family endonuclease
LLAQKDLKKISIHIIQGPAPLTEKTIEDVERSEAYGIDEVWIVSDSYFTPPASELARQKRFRLIDRAVLQSDLKF